LIGRDVAAEDRLGATDDHGEVQAVGARGLDGVLVGVGADQQVHLALVEKRDDVVEKPLRTDELGIRLRVRRDVQETNPKARLLEGRLLNRPGEPLRLLAHVRLEIHQSEILGVLVPFILAAVQDQERHRALLEGVVIAARIGGKTIEQPAGKSPACNSASSASSRAMRSARMWFMEPGEK